VYEQRKEKYEDQMEAYKEKVADCECTCEDQPTK
jgi:hypothetical protein